MSTPTSELEPGTDGQGSSAPGHLVAKGGRLLRLDSPYRATAKHLQPGDSASAGGGRMAMRPAGSTNARAHVGSTPLVAPSHQCPHEGTERRHRITGRRTSPHRLTTTQRDDGSPATAKSLERGGATGVRGTPAGTSTYQGNTTDWRPRSTCQACFGAGGSALAATPGRPQTRTATDGGTCI